MSYPRKREKFDAAFEADGLPKETKENLKGKSFDEVLASLANSDSEKIAMATAIINQIKTTGDPASLKALLASLERQGFANEKELPISDGRFIEIIKTVAERV